MCFEVIMLRSFCLENQEYSELILNSVYMGASFYLCLEVRAL